MKRDTLARVGLGTVALLIAGAGTTLAVNPPKQASENRPSIAAPRYVPLSTPTFDFPDRDWSEDPGGKELAHPTSSAPRVTVAPRTTSPTQTTDNATTSPPLPTEPPVSVIPPITNTTWGAPAWRDDFSGSALSDQWSAYRSPGHQHGDRDPAQCQVADGVLRVVSGPGRATCGMAHERDQRYGRWEARVRSTGGGGWNHLLIIWPESGVWPRDGETDWMEQDAGCNCFAGFIHFPGHTPERQVAIPRLNVEPGWHTIAMEWTAAGFKGWVDGKPHYDIPNRADLTGMPSGHLTIQADGGNGSALLEVDYVAGWDM